jgi:hypothetical protein
MRVVIGLIAVAVGYLLTSRAQQISQFSARWPSFRERHAVLRSLTIAPKVLRKEGAHRWIETFWRFCGALWIVGGILTLLGLSPGVR